MTIPWEASQFWNPHGGKVVRLEGGRYAQCCKIKAPRRVNALWQYDNRQAIRWLDTGEYEPCCPAKIRSRIQP